MTDVWFPDLDREDGPTYSRIASALVSDIRSGTLQSGSQLPAQRDLAYKLDVTVGTVNRAYQEVSRLGLIESGGRRGTRVKGDKISPVLDAPSDGNETYDLRGHSAVLEDWGSLLRQVILDVAMETQLDEAFSYDASPGSKRYRTAAAKWLKTVSGHAGDENRLVVTNGAQHALFCSLLVLCNPGDLVATERLTYVGLKSASSQLGLPLIPVDIDEHGLVPESFEHVCANNNIRVLVTVPDNHNPTTATQPLERRKLIAKIAARHKVTIIEDTVYSGLSPERIQPYAAIAPGNTFRIAGLSKTVGPGLRIGFVEAPIGFVDRLLAAVRATTWMASPLQSEATVRLIESGLADTIMIQNSRELALRNEIFRETLEEFAIHFSPTSPHAWVELPEPWTREQFQIWAIERGVLTVSAEAFFANRTANDQAVRISLSAAASHADLRRALSLIASAFRTQGPVMGVHA